jgi:hypothetical protein
MNGTYSFVYSGFDGVGLGVFHLRDSVLVGCDLGGCRYRGVFAKDEATGEIEMSLEQTVRPGVSLVQGTSPQDIPYTKSLSGRLPAEFDNGRPIELLLPPGPVTVMIHRVPDDWAPYAYGVEISITPEGPVPD